MDLGSQGEQEDAVPTEEAAKSIKAIDRTTVHRICSGQVVLTLATAVKELVENSIDAGATSVEVRLRDHGISLLEVCDNGKGVEEDDFEGLTLKHHTSKLRDFGDLVGVKTFGFRGEALSSLCALSNLSVITRHTSKSVGTKLVYDYNGKLSSKSPVSRQVGTTVTLQNLFSTLPVRHKEFQRNIKKEFAKMVQVLYSYCLISTGVRIVCTNQTEKGKKTIVVSTDGHNSVKENISSVFGAKQVSSLLEIKQETASGDVLAEYGMPTEDSFQENCLFSIEGFVSTCTHGQGRSATDRQFYFINSRPCDPAKVSKLVNEVYHHYNRHQSPFVVLNIRLREEDVDINVTPDKRQILVNHEKLLLATIKTSLIRLYENIPSTYSVQNGSLSSPLNRSFESSGSPSSNFASPNARSSNGRISALTLKFGRNVGGSPSPSCSDTPLSSPVTPGLKRSFSDNSGSSSNKQRRLDSFFMSKSQSDTVNSTTRVQDADVFFTSADSTININGIDEPDSNGHNSLTDCENGSTLEISHIDSSQEGPQSTDLKDEGIECDASYLNNGGENIEEPCTPDNSDSIVVSVINHSSEETNKVDNSLENDNADGVANILSNFSHSPTPSNARNGSVECSKNMNVEGDNVKGFLSRFSSPSALQSPSCKNAHSATDQFLSSLMAKKSGRQIVVKNTVQAENSAEDDLLPLPDDEVPVDLVENCESAIEEKKNKIVMCEEYDPVDYVSNRKSKQISFNIEGLRTKISTAALKKAGKELIRRFHAKIAPTDNKSAEDELKKEISKDMFAKMEILGQFNLGFIIVRLGSDLFIIDQHATDEKYNFETLQQTCILQNQRLIIPQVLELTAVNESILLDNIEIFRKNGFEFKIDEEKTVGRRVSLVSMPFSRGWEFGKEDIDELIFMLSDAPGVMCRPSRVRAMFASRACRKSVMIGTALTHSQMQKLVCHMGEIEQPWNCPHGRPTMRHLVNLDMISSTESQESS